MKNIWGIVRYAPNTGAFPDEDWASFDGWYSDRNEAEMIYRDWLDQFPHWIVAVVRRESVRW
jgi:hypothetical protein